MLSCSDVLARHSDYIDGDMTAEERASWHAHLAQCPTCARYDRVLRKGVSLLHEVPRIEPDATFHYHLRYRIADEDRRLRTASSSAPTAVAVAAVLMLVAVPVMMLTRSSESGLAPAVAAAASAVDANEIAWHGGSAVTRPASHISLASRTLSLRNTHAAVSVIENGYTPLVLDLPTAPPSY